MTYWVSENYASWPTVGTNALCTCDSESETMLTCENFDIVMCMSASAVTDCK